MPLAAFLAAATAVACSPETSRREGPAFGRDAEAFAPKGWSREALARPDLNRDGTPDVVVVARQPQASQLDGQPRRRLFAALSTPQGLRNVGEAEIYGHPLGEAHVEFTTRGVLVVTDLTGGVSANQAEYRYRYEGPSAMQGAMRYIGLDVTNYSRTNRHDVLNMSFNWLTGDFTKRVDKLTRRGDYAPQRTVRGRDEPRCLFMEDTEDPNNFIEAEMAD